MSMEAGRIIKHPRMVSTANMLPGVRFFPKDLPSKTFFPRMALLAEVTALPVAAMKLIHVKESSWADARETPKMILGRVRIFCCYCGKLAN